MISRLKSCSALTVLMTFLTVEIRPVTDNIVQYLWAIYKYNYTIKHKITKAGQNYWDRRTNISGSNYILQVIL